MEDYYDSFFYFHAGLFQLPISGVTHMCTTREGDHPACASLRNVSEWSAYRSS